MDRVFSRIYELLASGAGLDLEVCGRVQLEQVIDGRFRALGIAEPVAYLNYLAGNEGELQILTEELTVSETWFFRDRTPFELLAGEAQTLRRKVRVLSAPCATGEEAYSIAMSLTLHSVQEFEIDAYDINGRSIEHARAGVYSQHSFREKEPQIRDVFFTPRDGGWQISGKLQERTIFSQGNLCSDDIYSRMPEYDFIFCRNLMIYLLPEAREKLLANMAGRLRPGGLLFTGHSELIKAQSEELVDCGVRGAFALRRRGGDA